MDQVNQWCQQVTQYLRGRIQQAKHFRATDVVEELTTVHNLVGQLSQLANVQPQPKKERAKKPANEA